MQQEINDPLSFGTAEDMGPTQERTSLADHIMTPGGDLMSMSQPYRVIPPTSEEFMCQVQLSFNDELKGEDT